MHLALICIVQFTCRVHIWITLFHLDNFSTWSISISFPHWCVIKFYFKTANQAYPVQVNVRLQVHVCWQLNTSAEVHLILWGILYIGTTVLDSTIWNTYTGIFYWVNHIVGPSISCGFKSQWCCCIDIVAVLTPTLVLDCGCLHICGSLSLTHNRRSLKIGKHQYDTRGVV